MTARNLYVGASHPDHWDGWSLVGLLCTLTGMSAVGVLRKRLLRR